MNTKSRLELLYELLHDDPQDCFTRYAIALEHVKNNDNDKALAAFEDLRSTDPAYIPTYYQLGTLYANLGKLDDMRLVLTEGLERSKEASDMHTFSEIKGLLTQYFDEDDY